jgi:asparagine synthase (glutamine-hydrolysing)
MCGIAGILALEQDDRVDILRLRRMREVITHRGPDGAGLFLDGPVGLAHRRLAIVDVAGGQQPMANENGTIHVVFNGEIYNHRDLRPGLEAKGHVYRTRSDTETILHAYEEYGESTPEHLEGMFAFAIWDSLLETLMLARDRLGIKPLYYMVRDNELLFGSEIKALLAALPSPPTLDDRVLPEFLTNGYVTGEQTMFQGIKRLLPGHTLTWSRDAGFQCRQYWRVPEDSTEPTGTFKGAAHELREQLFAAVERHLMSDVPLGVFLSGGIDSTALAAIAGYLVKEPLQTFAVGFSEREANELGYARQAATWIGSNHREVVVSPQDFFSSLPRLVWHEDEPIAFPSSVPLNAVSRLASEHVKVVLTGEGADELFLGYNRYRVTHWNSKLGQAYWSLAPKAMRPMVRRLVQQLPSRVSRVLNRSFLGFEPGLRNIYLDNFAVVGVDRQHQLLKNRDLLEVDPHANALNALEHGDGDLLNRMSRHDLRTYLHELLMKQDQMSMAASIESRVPFLDDQLVGRIAGMPSSMKLRGWQTKALLREAVKDLIPPEILTRRKMGFPVPVGRWLAKEFRPMVDEFVSSPRAMERGLFNPAAIQQMVAEHYSGAARHGDRLWLLVNLEIWQRIFRDGETPDRLMDTPLQAAKAA